MASAFRGVVDARVKTMMDFVVAWCDEARDLERECQETYEKTVESTMREHERAYAHHEDATRRFDKLAQVKGCKRRRLQLANARALESAMTRRARDGDASDSAESLVADGDASSATAPSWGTFTTATPTRARTSAMDAMRDARAVARRR